MVTLGKGFIYKLHGHYKEKVSGEKSLCQGSVVIIMAARSMKC